MCQDVTNDTLVLRSAYGRFIGFSGGSVFINIILFRYSSVAFYANFSMHNLISSRTFLYHLFCLIAQSHNQLSRSTSMLFLATFVYSRRRNLKSVTLSGYVYLTDIFFRFSLYRLGKHYRDLRRIKQNDTHLRRAQDQLAKSD